MTTAPVWITSPSLDLFQTKAASLTGEAAFVFLKQRKIFSAEPHSVSNAKSGELLIVLLGAMMFGLVAAVVCAIPAKRVSRVYPMKALRSESKLPLTRTLNQHAIHSRPVKFVIARSVSHIFPASCPSDKSALDRQ